MKKLTTLKANNDLLNPNFDGYKLSCQDVKSYSCSISDGLWLPKKQESFSYLYTRLQTLHNYLFEDACHPQCVYLFNSRGHLLRYEYSEIYRLNSGDVVWQGDMSCIDSLDESAGNLSSLPPSIHFPTEDLAIVSNGCGKLHILDTNDRSTASSWLESFLYETIPGVVLHSHMKKDSETSILNVLFLALSTPKQMQSNYNSKHLPKTILTTTTSCVNVIHWITLINKGDKWELTRERHLTGLGSIEYCSFNAEVTDVILLAHNYYQFIYDSVKPIKEEIKEIPKVKPDFIYMQNNDDMIVWMNVEGKDNTKVEVTATTLQVKVKDTTVLEGTLHKQVESSAVTWTFKDDNQLEITLPKFEGGIKWDQLFSESCHAGEELLEQEFTDRIHERLAHLTSSSWEPSPEQDKPAYNPLELDACDEASEDLILLQLNGEEHDISLHSHLGATQHLINIPEIRCGSLPSFCLRYDVDGVVWQPEDNNVFTHRSTFNAFGYVRASKSLAKFVKAPADCSYAAICELKSHLYVFCQQDLFGGELRNRKSGKVINTVARQILISLKTHDEVIGMSTANGVIFILTNDKLYAYDFSCKSQ